MNINPHGRIRRAILALNAAPDVDPARATRAEVAAIHAANLAAWVVLTEGDVPPSVRPAPSATAIDVIDEALRPLLGSMPATSAAVAVFHALRRADALKESTS